MNESQLFPKKLTVSALVVMFSVLVFSFLVNIKNIKTLTDFSEKDAPSIQLSCAASRLIDELQYSNPSDAIQKREILQQTLQEIATLTKDAPLVSKSFLAVNSSHELQESLENYLLKKNEQLEEQRKSSIASLALTIFGSVFFLVLAVYIYFRYQLNLAQLNEISSKLENEKVKSIHSAKLASLGEMAAGMAHEINNPLAVIIGRSEISMEQAIAGNLTEAEIIKTLGKIKEVALRISAIVTSMRKISRGTKETTLRNMSVADVLTDVTNLMKEKLKMREIEIDFSSIPQEVMVKADFSLLSQILINLIGNATDALAESSLPEKKIWIETHVADDKVAIAVNDSGKGIPADIATRLFEPFYTTKDVGKGTGLGLSLSKTLAHDMGGDLILNATVANTRFDVILEKSHDIEA
ncbi:MAG: hypothetical protein K2P81_08775 [Bacteriovoracaceae bacterium]|nr:hypothetical protein [Bacteriovoracaceae bacterium]